MRHLLHAHRGRAGGRVGQGQIAGDREVVVLEETGDKTGIFEGSIATTLDIGDPIPGVLSLFDSEKFDVLYLDQARGNGSKDVEVRLTLPTAAAVTAL